MSIINRYSLTRFKQSFILLVMLMVMPMSECFSDENLKLNISASNFIYERGEPIVVFVHIQNNTDKHVKMINDLAREGWLVRLSIFDARGVIYYTSPSVKMEMLADSLKTFELAPNHIFGKEFLIGKTSSTFFEHKIFPDGKYYVQASFSTKKLKSWKLGIPEGDWESEQFEITIVTN